ncbi:hypothetical protein AMATHDRAFT_62512 [Amanita thiersii Skay4041]|uniref:BZIP domain-containing protein n=1 Tax=Amanita thiersii Skay4041 TaxID=703135 RepID=A0A2A9NPS8_9AGAR|nr:hypothetical protein AMATHDRAFT_62512 [Amanita thiersii Skay4041]
MAPSNLQGLNIIHPPPPPTDSQDLLGQPYPDLSAQLDLWTNLAFDSDEGPAGNKSDDDSHASKVSAEEEEEDVRSSPSSVTGENTIRGGHVNVPLQQHHPHQPVFDLNSLLAGFGIDPFAALQHQSTVAPSLAQLLAVNAHNPSPTLQSHLPVLASVQQQSRVADKPAQVAPASGHDESLPSAKRTRTRKTSDLIAAASSDGALSPEQASLLAAEDKRRRNTAASARFRLKKKEREAALEGRAKELELRVSELERECEGLRRENGWLKGLVVGVTGAAQAPAVVGAPIATPGMKRSRDEESP